MKNIVYEEHPSHIYHSKRMPFIFRSDSYESSRPGLDSNLHWHENPEFLRCRGGKGYILDAASKYPFSPGFLVSINPNSPHSFLPGPEEEMALDCLIVDAAFCTENGIDLNSLRFSGYTEDVQACVLFDRAFAACAQTGNFHILAARTAVLDFLLYMCRHHAAAQKQPLSVPGMEGIKKVVLYVRSHFAEPITLQGAAQIAGFSVYYFSHTFKKLTGQTFVTFLNAVRCESAAQLLREGASVTEACFASGFQELSYFSRTFKRTMGVAPSRVRQD